ncbi:Ribosome-interacting GTPase 2 [Entomophthora muscae]|nr:Ribosome-interacting GTPase 2 [Entomophthora muscae]
MSKLFIGSLSWNTDSESMRAAFEKFGEVTDSFVCKDRETQRSRGFGFITFADETCAQAAIDEMNGC